MKRSWLIVLLICSRVDGNFASFQRCVRKEEVLLDVNQNFMSETSERRLLSFCCRNLNGPERGKRVTILFIELTDSLFLVQLKYPAPGAPNLAKRVKELLEGAGFGHVREDAGRGLDHGAWVPLMLMYPEVNIPVCQLSIQSRKGAAYHYTMGKALAPLRDEGVLILGSGNATHNLRNIGPDGGPIAKWAEGFDTWLKESLVNGRHDDLNNFEEKAPYGKMAHPWPDHLFPLHVALGAAGEKAKAELVHHSWTNCTISYASYRFSTSD